MVCPCVVEKRKRGQPAFFVKEREPLARAMASRRDHHGTSFGERSQRIGKQAGDGRMDTGTGKTGTTLWSPPARGRRSESEDGNCKEKKEKRGCVGMEVRGGEGLYW
jgi:hypothetical protein